MKKLFRIIAALLVGIILCTGFCSCNRLDRLKNSRVHQKEEGFVCNGVKYVKLPDCNRRFGYQFINAYVVDENVPNLLTEQYGKPALLSIDGSILTIDEKEFYCIEPLYDDISTAFSKAPTECYGLESRDYAEDDITDRRVIVTDDEFKDIFERVISGTEILSDVSGYDYKEYINILKCSEDGVVVENADAQAKQLCVFESTALEKTLFVIFDGKVYHPVPDEHYEFFALIYKEITEQ